MTHNIRLLLVDDEPQIRRGLTMRFAAEPDLEVVGEAGDGFTAITLVEALLPDVVVMDLRMPCLDGISATRTLVEREVPSRVVVLSLSDDRPTREAAANAGAAAFVTKQDGPEKLIATIRRVALPKAS